MNFPAVCDFTRKLELASNILSGIIGPQTRIYYYIYCSPYAMAGRYLSCLESLSADSLIYKNKPRVMLDSLNPLRKMFETLFDVACSLH